jgi:3-isopropylmalate dehydrogenase
LTTVWSLRRALCQYPPSDFAEDAPKHHMLANDSFHIAVLPGDGIGPEVMAPALAVLEKIAAATPRLKFRFTEAPAGAGHYRDTGTSMPQSTIKLCEEADAILLGACGLPHIRYPDNTEIMPQVELRFMFDLYAGVRPCRLIANVPSPIVGAAERGIDLVVIRESTEGLFASMGKGVVSDTEARETLLITRKTSQRLFDFAFRLARRRKARGGRGLLTCVDKANAFKAYAFFRSMFDECAGRYADVATDRLYVDACAAMLVRRPWDFDVMVMENMFGDIISDLTAGLIGGMGMAPSADIGDTHAVFQPCHGTAPDIMGKGLANPTAMILSAALMLDWLAEGMATRLPLAPRAPSKARSTARLPRASRRANSGAATAPPPSPTPSCRPSTAAPLPNPGSAHCLGGYFPPPPVFGLAWGLHAGQPQ